MTDLSTRRELFYAYKLEKRVNVTFIFTFKIYFAHSPIEYEKVLYRSIWPVAWTLTGTTPTIQSGPGYNGSE